MAVIETLTADQVESKILTAPGVVALDFYQATCPPCRALEPHLERVATVYRGRFPVYRVDIDRDLPVARRFKVKSIPTILLVRSGKEISRLDGYITEADLKTAFDQALRRAN